MRWYATQPENEALLSLLLLDAQRSLLSTSHRDGDEYGCGAPLVGRQWPLVRFIGGRI